MSTATGKRKGRTALAILLAPLAILLAIALHTPLATAEQAMGVTIHVDCDGVPHVSIEMPVEPGLVKISAPVDVYPGTLEASVNGSSVPAVYENGTIYVAVDQPGHMIVTYVGVTQLSPEGELYFRLNTAGAQVIMSDCTILTSVPQNLADAQSDENGTLLIKLSGPDVVRYIPVSIATPLQTPPPPREATASPEETEPKPSQTLTEREQETPEQTPYETTAARVQETEETTTQPAQTSVPEKITQTTTATAAPTKTGGEGGLPTIALLGVVVAVLAAVAVFLLRKKG